MLKLVLAQGYDKNMNTVATVLDLKELGGISLNFGQSKDIPFSYTIPTTIAGNDIVVQLRLSMSSGFSLDWHDTPIEVTGTNTLLAIQRVSVTIGKESFTPSVGPTVAPGGIASLDISLTNTAKDVLTLTPVINMGLFGGEEKKDRTYPTVTLKQGEKQSISLPLPTSDVSGVYEGTLSLLDSKGVNHIQAVGFRYIVSGLAAVIHQVSVDKTNVKKGETFSATVMFSGPADDINKEPSTQNIPGIIHVVLYNESDVKVMDTSSPVDLNNDTTHTFSAEATDSAKAIRGDVTVTDVNGKVLATKNLEISGDYMKVKQDTKREKIISLVVYILLAVIIIVLLFVSYRKGKNRKALLSLVLVLMGFGLFGMPGKSEASWLQYYYTSTQGAMYLHMATQMPDPVIYSDTTQIQVRGTISSYKCTNSPIDVFWKVSVYNPTGILVYETGGSNHYGVDGGPHNSYYVQTDFATTNFTMPAGVNYEIDVQTSFNWTNTTSFYVVNDYKNYFTVKAPVVNLSASPTAIGPGQSSLLSFSSQDVNTCSLKDQTGVQLSAQLSGSNMVSPLTTTTYTYTCSGNYGAKSSSVVVTVVPPQLTFTVSPPIIGPGQSSTLTWSSQNVTSCTLKDSSGVVLLPTASLSGTKSVSPGSTTTYTMTCIGQYGNIAKSVLVTYVVPSATLTANPVNVGPGQASTLTWNSSNVTSCNLTAPPIGKTIASGLSGTQSVMSGGTTTYTLTCSGLYGSAQSTATVTIASPGSNISANPSIIDAGQSSDITWNASNVDSCQLSPLNSIDGSYGTTLSTMMSGTVNVTPNANTLYQIHCIGTYGPAASTATVNVTPLTLNLSASPTTINLGQSTTLTWTTQNLKTCSMDDGVHPVYSESANGGKQSSNPQNTTTYTMTCTGAYGGTISKSVTVNVNVPNPPTASITANATNDAHYRVGDTISYNWSSTNADTYNLMYSLENGTQSKYGKPIVCPSALVPTITTSTGSFTTSNNPLTLVNIGCIYDITFTATNSLTGQSAVSTIKVTVDYPVVTVTLTHSSKLATNQTVNNLASIVSSIASLFSRQLAAVMQVHLAWTVLFDGGTTNADQAFSSCTGIVNPPDGSAWSGDKSVTGGDIVVTPSPTGNEYSISCIGKYGPGFASDPMKVYPASISITPSCGAYLGSNPVTQARKGQVITWKVNDVPAGAYAFSWSGDVTPSSPQSTTVNSLNSTYTTSGSKSVIVDVIDANGATVGSCPASLRILTSSTTEY